MKKAMSQKYYLLLIPFCFILISCSKINYTGSYTKNLGHNYYGYLFLGQDSTFEYKSNEYSNTSKPYMPVLTMPSDSAGTGTYTIKKNKITLDYGSEEKSNVIIEKIEGYPHINEFNIDFRMYDKLDISESGMPFVEISFVKSSEGFKNGLITDVGGKASMQINRSDFPITLDCKFLGYAPEQIYLEEASNYYITIHFEEAPKKLVGKRIYPIKREKDTIDINGYRRVIYPKAKAKKK